MAAIPIELVQGLQYRRLLRRHPGHVVHMNMGLGFDALLRAGAKLRLPSLWGLARKFNDLRSLRAPVLFTEHCAFSRRGEFGFPNPTHEADLAVAGAFPNVICVSRDAYAYLGRRDAAAHAPRRRWFVPNGIDMRRFPFQALGEHEGLRVGYAGRVFRRGESPRFLTELARDLPDGVELHLAVASPMSDSEIRGRWFSGARVAIHRNIPNDAMASFYGSVDLLVNPMLWATMDRVTLEAMSCGRPVAVFDHGDRYPVTPESGFLIPTEDVPAFREMLRSLARDRTPLVARGRNARAIIEREFSQEVVARATEQIYRTLMSEQTQGPTR